MKTYGISSRNAISFGDRVLNDQNKKFVEDLRAKFDSFKENGIPVGDCFYKIPEGQNANLATADKKYKAGISNWGDNLIISEKLPCYDLKKAVIEPDGNVFYSQSVDEKEIEEIKQDSPLAQAVNEFLEKVLPKFVK